MSAGVMRAASSNGAPSTSSTTALPAARAARSRGVEAGVGHRSPSTRTPIPIRSPQGAPPAVPA